MRVLDGRRVSVLAIGLFVSLAASGMAACGSTEHAQLDEVSEGVAAVDLGDSFVDARGQTWVRTRRITNYSDESPTDRPSKRERPGEDEPKVSELPFEEAVEALRPYMEFGGSEYTLVDEDARENARMVLDAMRNPDAYPTLGLSSDEEEGLQPTHLQEKGIVGTDDRESIQSQRGSSPWKRIGHFWNGCSTFKLINNYTAITAGHCVHDGGDDWKTRRDLLFGDQAAMDKGCYAMTVPGCWDGDDGSECDYAIIRLRGDGPWCQESAYDVGYMGWRAVSDDDDNMTGIVAGYPVDDMKASWSYPELVMHERGGGYSSFWDVEITFYKNDTSGGQSGAPYLAASDDRVRAIHTAQYDSSENMGRSMRSSLVSWFNSNAGH